MPRLFATVLIGLAAVAPTGSADETADKSYAMAVASGRRLEWVRQVDRLFPNAEHSISYYTGEFGKPRWNSKLPLYGRYVLTADVEITLDEPRTKILRHAQPKFYLVEIARITEDPKTGQTTIQNGETEAEFGLDEWKKLVENNGNFSAIAIELVKDKPVPLFDKHWKKAG